MATQESLSDEPDLSFILSPNDPENVAHIVQNINILSANLTSDSHDKRAELLVQAQALVQALETPQETMLRHLWAGGATITALATCVKIGLFKHLAKDGGSPKTAVSLAEAIGINPTVLTRLLRHLAAVGHLIETGPDEYKPTRFSLSMTMPQIYAGYSHYQDVIFAAHRELPTYVGSLVGNDSPDPPTVMFQKGKKTDLSFFQYVATQPGMSQEFAYHMAGSRYGEARWMDQDVYPVQEKLVAGADTSPDVVFLVDVGGSTGHDIAEFNAKHPDVPGRLVLQDLPKVIEVVQELHPRVEAMAYDFFTEQPVKGARAYYMHHVLHDWPDDQSREILTQVKDAMKPAYSKLLINEHVILSTGASWRVTSLDVTLFTLAGAKERSEYDWRQLIEGVGLRICKIWSPVNGAESLIECELH